MEDGDEELGLALPGGKPLLVAAGVAAGLGLLYWLLRRRGAGSSLAPHLLDVRPSGVIPFYQLRLSPSPRLHEGADIIVPAGTPVRAIAAGVVRRADESDPKGYGSRIVVEHVVDGQRVRSQYAHLSQRLVKVGDQVQAGQAIAKSGGEAGAPGSGDSSGPHLHFEIIEGGGTEGTPAHDAGGPLRLDPIAFMIAHGVALAPGVKPSSKMVADTVRAQQLLLAARAGDRSVDKAPGRVLV